MPDCDETASTDALSSPIRRRVVEGLLSATLKERGMVLVANDVARFKAERGCEEYGVAAVREELLAEHVPVLVERGIVRYDEPEDRLELTADPDAVRERVGAVEEYE